MKKKLAICLSALSVVVMSAFAVNAEESAIQTALSTGLTGIASDLTSTLTTVLPVGLGIVGAVLVVTFGIKLFRKFTKG